MTKEIKEKLLHNNAPQNRDLDHKPVVKFFSPFNGSKWLITEMDSADDDSLFGLCDLGLGFPELGYVSLQELKDLKGIVGDTRKQGGPPTYSQIKEADEEDYDLKANKGQRSGNATYGNSKDTSKKYTNIV
jgi:hypothetical protein